MWFQRLVNTFICSGISTLEDFSELDEVDLDLMFVTNPEDRAKVLTAAQLLQDYDHSGTESLALK